MSKPIKDPFPLSPEQSKRFIEAINEVKRVIDEADPATLQRVLREALANKARSEHEQKEP